MRGDKLGCPTEFINLERIKARYGPDGIQDLPDSALFTNDTQMSVAIAEALIRAGERDIESILLAVGEAILKVKECLDCGDIEKSIYLDDLSVRLAEKKEQL